MGFGAILMLEVYSLIYLGITLNEWLILYSLPWAKAELLVKMFFHVPRSLVQNENMKVWGGQVSYYTLSHKNIIKNHLCCLRVTPPE